MGVILWSQLRRDRVTRKLRAFSTDVKDYPEGMSLYEKESLAAEAVLAARRKAKKKTARKPAAKPLAK
jgi:hypothetical protein